MVSSYLKCSKFNSSYNNENNNKNKRKKEILKVLHVTVAFDYLNKLIVIIKKLLYTMSLRPEKYQYDVINH